MAQEHKFISLRDILKKEKFPTLKFFKYSPSESEEDPDYPCAQTMSAPPTSPLALADSSTDVPENSSRNSMGEEKIISGNSSGKPYMGKLFFAPVFFLKPNESDKPLLYQILEGNDGVFILDGMEISVNISCGSWDEKRFKLALLYDESEDEKELQVNKKEKAVEKLDKEEEVAVGATNN